MRRPKYLSPTNLNTFNNNRETWYLNYISEHKPKRLEQSRPMSIGAAFDAYWKSYLVLQILGSFNGYEEFRFEAIFEAQVESCNRDWAKKHGKYAFEAYLFNGALASLISELDKASYQPRFEFTIQDIINGVPILGKPDLYFITQKHNHVIIDAKVNGYCSKASPKKGYNICRDGWVPAALVGNMKEVNPNLIRPDKHSRSHNQQHKDAQIMLINDLSINIAHTLDQIDKQWARQQSTYAWVLGEPVGGDFITGIEQLACDASGGCEYPKIRVAQHRMRVDKEFQAMTMKMYQHIWNLIMMDDDEFRARIFDDLSPDESAKNCDALDKLYAPTADSNKLWLQNLLRRQ